MSALPIGATLGILGTGQLGRMLAAAAGTLGFQTHVFGPEAQPPAAQFANAHTQASYDDQSALKAFAQSCDAITFEFENIPRTSLEILSGEVPLRPGLASLETSQDRLIEKQFLESLDLSVAPYSAIDQAADIETAHERLGGDTIVKTRRLGYDGKGQIRLRPDQRVDGADIWQNIGRVPCVLEARIPFVAEISAIIARDTKGQTVVYDTPVNHHKKGILDTSAVGQFADIAIPEAIQNSAQQACLKIAHALDHVGVLTTEFFVKEDGQLLINEIAPRVHNSGHWTMDACLHDQFDNHVRAVAGWPLGPTERHSDAKMTNLIGADVDAPVNRLASPDRRLHLYGKRQARPGRKMGHINQTAPR